MFAALESCRRGAAAAYTAGSSGCSSSCCFRSRAISQPPDVGMSRAPRGRCDDVDCAGATILGRTPALNTAVVFGLPSVLLVLEACRRTSAGLTSRRVISGMLAGPCLPGPWSPAATIGEPPRLHVPDLEGIFGTAVDCRRLSSCSRSTVPSAAVGRRNFSSLRFAAMAASTRARFPRLPVVVLAGRAFRIRRRTTVPMVPSLAHSRARRLWPAAAGGFWPPAASWPSIPAVLVRRVPHRGS